MSFAHGPFNYNRFSLLDEGKKKSLAAKCDPKDKVTRRDVIAGATGTCEEVEVVMPDGSIVVEKKELPDFLKKGKDKDDDDKKDKKDDKPDFLKKGKDKKKDDCECKEEVVGFDWAREAYAAVYQSGPEVTDIEENRQAAYTAGQSDAKKSMQSKPAKVTGGKTYTMKGKDGKPLFKEESIDEGSAGSLHGGGSASASSMVNSGSPAKSTVKAMTNKGPMPKGGTSLSAMRPSSFREETQVDEALTGERKRRAREKSFSPYTRGQDKATLHNLGTRNDGPGTPGYEKKSTGGKGARYAGYGDQGAGNKARRRMGQEPLRGNTRMEEALDEKSDLAQARNNVGADTCWDGYKAKGTKMKGGKIVPNCVKEDILEYMLETGIANNIVSAEAIYNHASDEFLAEIEEGYVDPFKSPTNAHPRGSMGSLSPAMKMMKKSDQLRGSEEGSKRQKKQTKASQQMNRVFQSARNTARNA